MFPWPAQSKHILQMLVCTNKGCARAGEQAGWAYNIGLAEKGVGAKEEEEEGQCADHRRGQ